MTIMEKLTFIIAAVFFFCFLSFIAWLMRDGGKHDN
jgi:cbb3-type cytochrome oxidase subunit 3